MLFEEEDSCLHVAFPVATFPENAYKSATTRATAATRAGCVQRGMGQATPLECSSRNAAEDDPWPKNIQLNTGGLTAGKISVIEQLAYKNKAFIIVIQETD